MAGTCTYMMRWTLPWVASRGATPSAITIPAVRLATANHPSPRCSPLIGRRGRLHRRAPRARRPPPRSIVGGGLAAPSRSMVGGGLAAPSEPPQRMAPAKPALEEARSSLGLTQDRSYSRHQGVDEPLGIEGPEVLDLLAHPDELDGEPELARDPHHDAALGGAVELGEHYATQPDRLVEHTRLGEAVLSGGGVEHHQALVRRAGQLALDDALELGQLHHQVGLRV